MRKSILSPISFHLSLPLLCFTASDYAELSSFIKNPVYDRFLSFEIYYVGDIDSFGIVDCSDKNESAHNVA